MRVNEILTTAVAAVLLVGFGLAGPVAASHGHSIDDPWTRGEDGVIAATSLLEPTESCNEDAGTMSGNGVFGKVWALPDGADDHWFGLSVDFPLHVDAKWYQQEGGDCHPLGTDHGDGRLSSEREIDEVPDGATHVVIWYREGTGSYLLEIPVPEPAGCDISPFC